MTHAAAAPLSVPPDAERRSRAFVFAALLILLPTVLGMAWAATLGSRNLSLLFFIAILFTGLRFGKQPALFAAFLAFLSYNFFLVEPRYSLHIAAADVLAFATFLIGAFLVGGLSGSLSDRAREAKGALRSVTSLFDASSALSRTLDPDTAARRLVAHLETGGCRAGVWIGEAAKPRLSACSAGVEEDVGRLQDLFSRFLDSNWVDEIGPSRQLLRLMSGEHVVGAVVILPAAGEASIRSDQRWTRTLLDLGAVAIDRARLIREIAEARVVAEKEGLRTALLSSLSHDLRTPLSTILASATSLQEHDGSFDSATRLDLLGNIQDEAERLNRYVTNLLEMTRLESGVLQLRRSLIDPGEAMASALKHVERKLTGHSVVREFRPENLRIDVDPVLLEQALVNVLENAIEHAPADSKIVARVAKQDQTVVISIEDKGRGVAGGEIERIFEKFFRGSGDRNRASGVGLGLSVTRGLIESFGGSVRAVSPAENGIGTRIEIRLPAHPALETTE